MKELIPNDLPIESFTNSELVKLKNDLGKKVIDLNDEDDEFKSISSILLRVNQEIEKRKEGNLMSDDDFLSPAERRLKAMLLDIENISDEELVERIREGTSSQCEAVIQKGEILQEQFYSEDSGKKMLLQHKNIQVNNRADFTARLQSAFMKEAKRRRLQ